MTTIPASVTILDLAPAASATTGMLFESSYTTSSGNATTVQVLLSQIMTTTFGGLPTGGDVGQLLQKNSTANYASNWVNISSALVAGTAVSLSGSTTVTISVIATAVPSGLPTGGGTGQFLQKIGAEDYTSAWVNLGSSIIGTNGISVTGSTTVTIDYTPPPLTAPVLINGTSATAFMVGAVGTSNPVLNVDTQNSIVNFNGTVLLTGTLNVVGPSVMTGAVSVIGTTNVTGRVGIVGTTLVTGLVGIVGTTVATGVVNVVGTTNVTGLVGIVGTTLVTGLVGIVGTTLVTGLVGVVGTATFTGAFNVIGTAAVTGLLQLKSYTTYGALRTATTGDISTFYPNMGQRGYTTNRYQGLQTLSLNGAATATLVTATLYAVPIFVSDDTTFTRIGVDVMAAAATGKIARLGIYNWSTGAPTNLALDAGTVAVDSTGIKEITISQSVTAGIYALAIVSDGNPGVRGNSSPTASALSVLSYSVPGSLDTNVISTGVATTALPSSFGAATYTSGNTPFPWLRIV